MLKLILISFLSQVRQSFWLQTSKHTSKSNWPTMRTITLFLSSQLSQSCMCERTFSYVCHNSVHVFEERRTMYHTQGLAHRRPPLRVLSQRKNPKEKQDVYLLPTLPLAHSPLCLCSIHLYFWCCWLVGEGILKVLHKNGQQYRSGAFTFVSFSFPLNDKQPLLVSLNVTSPS